MSDDRPDRLTRSVRVKVSNRIITVRSEVDDVGHGVRTAQNIEVPGGRVPCRDIGFAVTVVIALRRVLRLCAELECGERIVRTAAYIPGKRRALTKDREIGFAVAVLIARNYQIAAQSPLQSGQA
jgi:hypothetical protein